jgi:hypothetical protein
LQETYADLVVQIVIEAGGVDQVAPGQVQAFADEYVPALMSCPARVGR